MKIFYILLIAYTGYEPSAQTKPSTTLHRIPPSVYINSTCPSTDFLPSLRLNIQQVLTCGNGNWIEVANIDMTDSSQSCPSPWNQVSSPSRLCTSSSCQDGAVFSISSPYTHVCGRVVGYAYSTPDGFLPSGTSTDSSYLDGVSITYGSSPRRHIWSLAAGHDDSMNTAARCPCENKNRYYAPLPPSFVGENYFCASVRGNDYTENIWDGRSCSGPCCHFHSPPWFSVSLEVSTSDDIEVRICTDSSAIDEVIYLQQIQLLVQ